MNVGQLKEHISRMKLPDNAPVLLSGSDHSLHTAAMIDDEATQFGKDRDYAEFFGEEHLADGEHKIQALVIR